MKTIQNKNTTILVAREGGTNSLMDYAEIIKAVMTQQRKPEGYSTEEMRKDFRVIDAIDSVKEKEEIDLEDADFEYFKSKLKTMRWSLQHKDLIQFEDDINEIK